jgi:hypothetical protein
MHGSMAVSDAENGGKLPLWCFPTFEECQFSSSVADDLRGLIAVSFPFVFSPGLRVRRQFHSIQNEVVPGMERTMCCAFYEAGVVL